MQQEERREERTMSTWSLSLGLGRGPAEQEEGGSLAASSVCGVPVRFCVEDVYARLVAPQVGTPQCG